jgi:hypothetical protein
VYKITQVFKKVSGPSGDAIDTCFTLLTNAADKTCKKPFLVLAEIKKIVSQLYAAEVGEKFERHFRKLKKSVSRTVEHPPTISELVSLKVLQPRTARATIGGPSSIEAALGQVLQGGRQHTLVVAVNEAARAGAQQTHALPAAHDVFPPLNTDVPFPKELSSPALTEEQKTKRYARVRVCAYERVKAVRVCYGMFRRAFDMWLGAVLGAGATCSSYATRRTISPSKTCRVLEHVARAAMACWHS